MKHVASLSLVLLLLSCNHQDQTQAMVDLEAIKQDIFKAEEAFNNMAQEKGVKEAFLSFADENAVINRGGKAIKGKKEIEAYFNSQTLQNVSLVWNPEFVDVAASGDMAYTYGPFTFKATQPTGEEINAQGIFHTVWRKQSNGSWKFVYD